MMLLGSFLALLSAVTFAMNGATVRRGVLTGTVVQAMAITVPAGLPLFFFAALSAGQLNALAEFPARSVLLLVTAGALHFVWGRYCNFRAMKAIGGNASALLQQLDFPLKITLAVIFLSETLTLVKILGIGLIMLGSAIGVKQQRQKDRAIIGSDLPIGGPSVTEVVGTLGSLHIPAFMPRYAEGYTFALLSVTGYGVSPLFVRMALQDTSMGASLAGGLISYAAATFLIGLMWIKPGQLRHVLSVNAVSAKWFSLSAVLVALSQMFQYMALAVAPITVVAPIQRSAVLFRVVLNWLVNRQHEVFETRLIVGIFISVLGIGILSVSTDSIIEYLSLSDFFTDITRWTWP